MTISFSKEDQNLSMPQKQTLWNQWQSSIINIKRLLYIYKKRNCWKSNGKYFISNKSRNLARDYRNKGEQENPKKMIVKVNITEVYHITYEAN